MTLLPSGHYEMGILNFPAAQKINTDAAPTMTTDDPYIYPAVKTGINWIPPTRPQGTCLINRPSEAEVQKEQETPKENKAQK